MRWIKKLLRLSEKGYQDMVKAVWACVFANLSLLVPFGILMITMETMLEPLMYGTPLNTGKLWLLFGAGIVSAIIYFVLYLNEYDKTYTSAYSECENMRVDVAEKMRKLPLSFFNRKDLTELTTNIMGDCSTIEHSMSHVVPSMIANIMTITLSCVLLSIYNWRMSLAIFCAMPICFAIILLSRKIQAKFGERHVIAKLQVSDQVQEYLDGIKVIKAFGLEGEKTKELENAMNRMMKEAILFEGVTGAFVATSQMLLRVGTGLVVFVGVNLLTGGTLGVIPFLTFLLISVKIYAPITVLFSLLPEFFYMLTSTKRMQILREEPIMEGDTEAVLADCNIHFDNVTFAYNQEAVIKNMTIDIKQNEVTALVGPSGSGKSTVSRLAARFWDTASGDVVIGGKVIKDVDPERLMQYMSFVFQDVVLFNDTVMNNIRIGKTDATDEEIKHAAKMARCDEFIAEMPNGYDTMLGENGSTLSGGQRQRISIARALLKDAPIVLLDEATASLDPENEVLIQEAISELVKGRTVMVIAHRLRTIMDADNIIVLDNGEVVEQGTGDELLKKNGLFANLYNIQQESLGWTV